MSGISTGRVIGGGLLAGLVFNVFDFLVQGVYLQAEWTAALTALGHPAAMAGSTIMVYVLLDFFIGIFGVWLYAAMRPRFGAGPKTAIIAGLTLWCVAIWMAVQQAPTGLYPAKLVWMPVLVALIQYPLGVMVGGKVYQEEGAEAHATAM